MTLPPELIGDKGQRYKITYTDVETADQMDYGYANSFEGAQKLLKACRLWPIVADAEIVDREGDENEET